MPVPLQNDNVKYVWTASCSRVPSVCFMLIFKDDVAKSVFERPSKADEASCWRLPSMQLKSKTSCTCHTNSSHSCNFLHSLLWFAEDISFVTGVSWFALVVSEADENEVLGRCCAYHTHACECSLRCVAFSMFAWILRCQQQYHFFVRTM